MCGPTRSPQSAQKQTIHRPSKWADPTGSALLAAVFVLLLLSASGVVLLFLSQMELKMNRGAHRAKQVFYRAEAGVEHGRALLHATVGLQEFDQELEDAAGLDGDLQFDVNNLQVQYDGAGVPTGLTGFGDDDPLVPLTAFADGWYATFLNNDPDEGIDVQDDENDRVMLTSVGVDSDGSAEVVQVIVAKKDLLTELPPATITLLGPLPDFDGGTADPHDYSGDDCGGSGPEGSVAVVGTIDDTAEANAEMGIHNNADDDDSNGGPDYESGPWSGDDTFANLHDTNEPTVSEPLPAMWTDCDAVHDLVEELREAADVVCCTEPVCDPPVPSTCTLPATSISNLIFIDGDWTVGPAGGAGTLVVTGEVNYNGQASWQGVILALGEGRFERNGGGNGDISGAIMVADIAGPDDLYGTADDCTGGDNGFDSAEYENNGGGNADTGFCSTDIIAARPNPPYDIVAFRQF